MDYITRQNFEYLESQYLLNLKYSDILSFCSSHMSAANVCRNLDFWKGKIKQDIFNAPVIMDIPNLDQYENISPANKLYVQIMGEMLVKSVTPRYLLNIPYFLDLGIYSTYVYAAFKKYLLNESNNYDINLIDKFVHHGDEQSNRQLLSEFIETNYKTSNDIKTLLNNILEYQKITGKTLVNNLNHLLPRNRISYNYDPQDVMNLVSRYQ